jgi:hypothetical protein
MVGANAIRPAKKDNPDRQAEPSVPNSMMPFPFGKVGAMLGAMRVLTLVVSVGAQPVRTSAPGADKATARFELLGQWTGAEWGDVVIAADGSGSYTDTYHTGPGRLRLVRAGDRRYEGTWSESRQRYGTVVLELQPQGNVATGTWTPSQESTIGSRTGGPVSWTRR